MGFLSVGVVLMVIPGYPFLTKNTPLERFIALPWEYFYTLIAIGFVLIGGTRRKGDILRVPSLLMGGGSAILSWALFRRPWPSEPIFVLAGFGLMLFGGVMILRRSGGKQGSVSSR